MTGSLHILRTAYQIGSMQELSEVQAHFRMQQHNGRDVVMATTRRKPQREAELLDGGSIYWIIKNQIQARQKILDIDMVEEDADSKHCRIFLDPKIIRVTPKRKRAVQGWRYLQGFDVPKDIGPYYPTDDDLPEDLAKEIRDLGVI